MNKPVKTLEKQSRAFVFITQLYCTTDNVAMTYTDKTFPTQPPKFEYRCPKCGHREISTVRYPFVTYKEKESE